MTKAHRPLLLTLAGVIRLHIAVSTAYVSNPFFFPSPDQTRFLHISGFDIKNFEGK